MLRRSTGFNVLGLNAFSIALVGGAVTVCSAPVLAQQSPSAPAPAESQPANAASEGILEDIVVTANREESLLSKTPVAITALTPDALRDQGITEARFLNDLVPNFRLTENREGARIAIRGVTSTDATEKGDPSAAFLLDGVYIARPEAVLGAFYDLERVEVLRGPQGTLYGRNTTAGVVNVISARPVPTFEASVDATVGSLGTRNVTAMVNLPVGAALGLRLATNFDRKDNIITKGVPSDVPLDPAREVLSARLSFGGQVADKLDFVMRVDHTDSEGAMQNGVPLSNVFGPLTPGVDPVYLNRDTDQMRSLGIPEVGPSWRDYRYSGIMGEFTYDLGPVQMTYLGSYRENHRDDRRNLILFPAGVYRANPAAFNGDYDQQSHELRASFGRDSRLHGQAGLYYFQEQSAIEVRYGAPLATNSFGPSATTYIIRQDPTKSSSEAAFASLTFDLLDDLHLTAGARYTEDEKSRVGVISADYNAPIGDPTITIPASRCSSSPTAQTRCTVGENDASRKFEKTTWKVGLDYDSAIGLFYASVATGYKAGGFNDGCLIGSGGIGCSLPESVLYFQPETLTAYEVGFKLHPVDFLRFNGSAFHYDYSDLQLQVVVTNPPGQRFVNAASSEIDGVELEAIVTAIANGRIDLSVNYTDARFSDFTVTNSSRTVTRDFEGLQLDQAPEWSGSVGYVHTFELAKGVIEAGARSRYSSSYRINDLANASQFRQPSFTKSDATVTYWSPGHRTFVQAFVKNIENELTLAHAQSGLLQFAQFEESRTYGLRAGTKF